MEPQHGRRHGTLAHWRLRLSELEFGVVHRAGTIHQAAEALSQLATDNEDNTPFMDDVPVLLVSDSPNGPPDGYLCMDYDCVPAITPCLTEVMTIVDSETTAIPPTTGEFLAAQSSDRLCEQLAKTVGTPGLQYSNDRRGYLVLASSLDGTIQKVTPWSRVSRILYLSHFSAVAAHSGARRMYETLRRDYYWPHMAKEVYLLIKECPSCAKTRVIY